MKLQLVNALLSLAYKWEDETGQKIEVMKHTELPNEEINVAFFNFTGSYIDSVNFRWNPALYAWEELKGD